MRWPGAQPCSAAVLAAVLGAVLGAAVLTTGGCAGRITGKPVVKDQLEAHREIVTGYFEAVNAAAEQGSAAQEQLFARTQHPDFRDQQCSLRGLTVTADPAYDTLHPAPDWRPSPTGDQPRGTVYVVAASITVQRGSTILASQIGSLHVVVLDGAAYGFSPCPA